MSASKATNRNLQAHAQSFLSSLRAFLTPAIWKQANQARFQSIPIDSNPVGVGGHTHRNVGGDANPDTRRHYVRIAACAGTATVTSMAPRWPVRAHENAEAWRWGARLRHEWATDTVKRSVRQYSPRGGAALPLQQLVQLRMVAFPIGRRTG